jgi:hypothetical protein
VKPNDFQVEFVGGNTGFGPRIVLLRETSQSFVEKVKAVLIVADKDDNAEVAFTFISSQLREANFPVPAESGRKASKNGYPDVVVLLLPIRGNGNLETLCLEAMEPKWGITAALKSFIASTPAAGWGPAKQSKARMGSLLSAVCEEKPDTSFAGHWELNEKYHLPLDEPCFEELIRFFRNFGRIINPV